MAGEVQAGGRGDRRLGKCALRQTKRIRARGDLREEGCEYEETDD
jgi:hypothetical protein